METVLITVLAALLLCAVAALLLTLFLIVIPMRRLTRLTETAEKPSPESLRAGAEQIGGAPGKAAKALIEACEKAGTQEGVRTDADPTAEERYKKAVVDEICASLMPRELKNRLANMTFSLKGAIQPGKRRSCAFTIISSSTRTPFAFPSGRSPETASQRRCSLWSRRPRSEASSAWADR